MQNLALELKQIRLDYGPRTILELAHLPLYQREKIGIVGDNGQGKTSLLKLLAGTIQPDSGEIIKKIDFAFFQQISAREQHSQSVQLTAECSVEESLIFSGGEETRLKLKEVLSGDYEGLLLDEPTTHLDQPGIRQLIATLAVYEGTLLIVSHDRSFLDQTVTKIWEVSEGQVNEYYGNYSEYQRQKDEEAIRLQKTHSQYYQEKRRLEAAVTARQVKATKMAQVSAKQKKRRIQPSRLSGSKQKDTALKGIQQSTKNLRKRLEQLEVTPKMREKRSLKFQQGASLVMHNNFPIIGEQVNLLKGEKQLLTRASFQFPLGAVIVIEGANGSGKTSLLQHILNQGQGVTVSPKVVFGYYEQLAYRVTSQLSILPYLLSQTSQAEAVVRGVLHQLGFSKLELTKTVYQLSGGERIRLLLALLFLKEANVLVLDEPTNFVDITTLNALECFIKEYPGTIVLTSHDHYFVERVASQRWRIQEQQLILQP